MNTSLINKYRYIRPTKKGYRIQKHINKKNTHYGNYHTLKDAMLVRDNLEKHNWDKKHLDEICEEVGVYRVNHRQKMTKGGCKYTLWDSHKVQYHKNVTQPEKRFRVLWNYWSVNIGQVSDFVTCEIIHDLISEIVLGEKGG